MTGAAPAPTVGPTAFNIGTHRSVPPAVTAERIRGRLSEFGITRVAELTGLDHVGIPVMAAYRPAATSLVVSMGKGLTADAAYASATMESIELWHAERPALDIVVGSARALAHDHEIVDWSTMSRVARQTFDENTTTAWVVARSFTDGRPALVPYGVVHTDGTAAERGDGGHFLCTSNGLASGNVAVEAQVHALCELIERDATTTWRLAGRRLDTVVAAEAVTDPAARELLGRLAAAGLRAVVDDITSDIGIPTAHCTVFEPTDDPDACVLATAGMGTHPDPSVALARAVTEAAQSRLALISGARDDLFRPHYQPPEDADLLYLAMTRRWETARVSRRAWLATTGPPVATLEGDLALVVDELGRHGLEAWWVDLTMPGIGVAVGRAVVPGLEMLNDVAHYTPGPRARAVAMSGSA
ncbi:YcaO-like family protein [Kribbella alba]|uniref:YcaO-like family protein n=1 Tax=Kribbella alba TaxID=190197 RepID=A0ABN2FYW6_9ACTN